MDGASIWRNARRDKTATQGSLWAPGRRHGRGHATASASRQAATGADHVGYAMSQRGMGAPTRRALAGAASRQPVKRAEMEGQGEDMASTDDYLEYVRDLLGGLDDVAHRKMMGEYVIYYRGKVVGGIYDDRFLLKITPTSERLLAGVPRVTPTGAPRTCFSSRPRTARRCATWSARCGRSFPPSRSEPRSRNAHRVRTRSRARRPGLATDEARPAPQHRRADS